MVNKADSFPPLHNIIMVCTFSGNESPQVHILICGRQAQFWRRKVGRGSVGGPGLTALKSLRWVARLPSGESSPAEQTDPRVCIFMRLSR